MHTLEERRLKGPLKATAEAVRESREDLAMLQAIQQGEKSQLTSRKLVFKRLKGAA